MATPDKDVIKEIPVQKVTLMAVLKSHLNPVLTMLTLCLISLLVMYKYDGQSLLSFISCKEADSGNSKSRDLEEKVHSLEMQVQLLQKLVKTQDNFHSLEKQVEELKQFVKKHDNSHYTTIEGFPRDCLEIYEKGTRTDGIYSISPDGRCPFSVYCDMKNGGWTLIQKRLDDRVNFYRAWDDYVNGFGDIDGSHWLGLEKIHRLTRDSNQIYFDMENYEGKKEYAHYKVFTVHEAATAYTMNVDAFNYEGNIDELLSYHNNMKFSTYDRDNDVHSRSCCVDLDGGGWWYKDCYRLGNVNGVYGKKAPGGIGYWTTKNIPMKNVTIKVKDIRGRC